MRPTACPGSTHPAAHCCRRQSRPRSSPTRQSENLVGAQIDITGAAHARDLTFDTLPADNQAGAVLVELELNLASGTDAKGLPDLEGDRDLSLLRNSHAGKTNK